MLRFAIYALFAVSFVGLAGCPERNTGGQDSILDRIFDRNADEDDRDEERGPGEAAENEGSRRADRDRADDPAPADDAEAPSRVAKPGDIDDAPVEEDSPVDRPDPDAPTDEGHGPNDGGGVDDRLDPPPADVAGEVAAFLADKKIHTKGLLGGGFDPSLITTRDILLCGFGRFQFVEVREFSFPLSSTERDEAAGTWSIEVDAAGGIHLVLNVETTNAAEGPGRRFLLIEGDLNGRFGVDQFLGEIESALDACAHIERSLDAAREFVADAGNVLGDKLVRLETSDSPDDLFPRQREVILALCSNGRFQTSQGLIEGNRGEPQFVDAAGTWAIRFDANFGAILDLEADGGAPPLFVTGFQIFRAENGALAFISFENAGCCDPFISDEIAEIQEAGAFCGS